MKPSLAVIAIVLLASCRQQDPAPTARDSAGQPVAVAPAAPAPPPPAQDVSEPAPQAAAPAPAPDPASPAAAAELVRRYHALIGAGDYAAAYRLWQGEGAAAQMSAADFAASFAKYASYSAEIGTPGRLDPGAGNVYVEVPVRITGQLRSGGAFRMEGPMRLHRVNDVPGATPAQRNWQIVASGIRPR